MNRKRRAVLGAAGVMLLAGISPVFGKALTARELRAGLGLAR